MMAPAELADPATTVKLLLAHGAQVNWPKREYDTERDSAGDFLSKPLYDLLILLYGDALSRGTQFCPVEVGRILIEAGAKVDSEHLSAATQKQSSSIVDMLIDRGVEIDKRALEDAIQWHSENLLQKLLDTRPTVDTQEKPNLLVAASVQGSLTMIKRLLDTGADWGKQYYSDCLKIAFSRGSSSTVKLPIDHGADVNTITESLQVWISAASTLTRMNYSILCAKRIGKKLCMIGVEVFSLCQ